MAASPPAQWDGCGRDSVTPYIPFHVAAVLALIPAIGTARSGLYGQGGTLALAMSAVFALAAILLWTGESDSARGPVENTVAGVLRRSITIAVVGYLCIASRLGVIVLLAVPFYWLSVPIVVVSVLLWSVMRTWRALQRPEAVGGRSDG